MKIEIYYPGGKENKKNSPLCLDVAGLNLAGFKIEARTYTKSGSEIHVYYNDKKIYRYTYKREMFPTYQTEMACDIYQAISSTLPSINLEISKLFEITPLIIEKCEFHQGRNINESQYEVLVTFF